jgi:ABC-type transport system involved in cytochrome c biogenesis permease subunit
MFCYGVFGVVTVMAIYRLITKKGSENSSIDSLVYVGLALMTTGMLFGALWAKEAWGHYWNWDPKETWAAITWFAYLLYIHYRRLPKCNQRLALWMLVITFALLQMCWWGINYLPSAQGVSVHTYN